MKYQPLEISAVNRFESLIWQPGLHRAMLEYYVCTCGHKSRSRTATCNASVSAALKPRYRPCENSKPKATRGSMHNPSGLIKQILYRTIFSDAVFAKMPNCHHLQSETPNPMWSLDIILLSHIILMYSRKALLFVVKHHGGLSTT